MSPVKLGSLKEVGLRLGVAAMIIVTITPVQASPAISPEAASTPLWLTVLVDFFFTQRQTRPPSMIGVLRDRGR